MSKKTFPEFKIQEIITKYREGAVLKDLALELGVTGPTVAKMLRTRGVDIRPKGRRKKNSV
jgi:Mn-dependent DtxR family transcriptional regulator